MKRRILFALLASLIAAVALFACTRTVDYHTTYVYAYGLPDGSVLGWVAEATETTSQAEAGSPQPGPWKPLSKTDHRYGAAAPAGSGNQNIWYYAGTSGGTVTVPAGAYVTLLTATGNSDGGIATITVTPNGVGYPSIDAGPPITILAGSGFSWGRGVLIGSLSELGPGTVIAFSGTATYFVSIAWVP